MHPFEEELVTLLAEAEAALPSPPPPRELEWLAIKVEQKARLAKRVARRQANAELQARATALAGALRARLEQEHDHIGATAIAVAQRALHAIPPDEWRRRLDVTESLFDVNGTHRAAARELQRAVCIEVLTTLADACDAGTMPATAVRRALHKALDVTSRADDVPRTTLERALRQVAQLDAKLIGVVAASSSVRELARHLRQWDDARASSEVLASHAARLSTSRAANAEIARLSVEADAVLSGADMRSSSDVHALVARIKSSRALETALAKELSDLERELETLASAADDLASLRFLASEALRECGRVSTDYAIALRSLALALMRSRQFDEAESILATTRELLVALHERDVDECPLPEDLDLDRVLLAIHRGDLADARSRLASFSAYERVHLEVEDRSVLARRVAELLGRLDRPA